MASPYKTLWINGKKISEHRYIMEQYLGRELLPTEIVHHINGDGRDNRIENLQVMTAAEHVRVHHQKYAKTKICVICGKEFTPDPTHRRGAKTCSLECWHKINAFNQAKNKKPVGQFDLDGNLIKIWDSASDVQTELGYSNRNISACCHHKPKCKTAFGYQWKFMEDEQ